MIANITLRTRSAREALEVAVQLLHDEKDVATRVDRETDETNCSLRGNEVYDIYLHLYMN